ncbi:putative N-acetyltransferase domain-containing protein [Seiridium unicorne]|uniref:N-acetyltransferase domain-containing protein n=1 Tax=Seiridium unicorne TaxID=138068 RepID=A0ABR2UHN7_9PEZI
MTIRNDYIADAEDGQSYSTDEDGIRYSLQQGFPSELRFGNPPTEWAFVGSVDVLDPEFDVDFSVPYDENDRQTKNKLYEVSTLAHCAANLIRPDIMRDRADEFRSLVWMADEGLRHAAEILFEPGRGVLKNQFRRKGVWGSEGEGAWILAFERLFVHERARRQGWATKLVTRIMHDILDRAREANRPVLVLVMPAAPEKEFRGFTDLTEVEKVRTQEDNLRAARSFWRSLGFVRMGETLLFGWTRAICGETIPKLHVREEDLDEDGVIDQRQGHLFRLHG